LKVKKQQIYNTNYKGIFMTAKLLHLESLKLNKSLAQDSITKKSMTQKHGILVSDFDGTMTTYDFYDLICKEFPEVSAGGFWEQYEEGKITHFEALRLIFASIKSTEDKIISIIKQMKIEPILNESIELLKKNNWDVVVASAGCEWYIKKLLQWQNVSIPVYANPGIFTSSKGLLMSLPDDKSPFFSREIGINKMAVVHDALKKYSNVAFAGDGRPDLGPALLVPPELRFAKHWLAKKLHELGEEFIPFEHWSDVVKYIVN
jgi:2-hydroxy-3-keto-5-methylthiopentenyl-1-phosphate phosphatase